MPQIRPIAELRNTCKISQLCHDKAEPIFITKNGYGDLVVMSMNTYETQMALSTVYKKLGEAEKEVSSGIPLLDGTDVFNNLRNKYGR